MANANRNKELFYIKPTIAALAVTFTSGAVYAADETAKDEAATLPEVKVAAPKDKSTGYKTEKASSSKFTAPLLDTPKSITVITEDVIKDSGSNSLEQALRTVPGVTFGAAEGGGSLGDRPFIRGFDSQASMYVDGMRDNSGQSREVFAIESVEVLKGPSGAYDGRGSAGGSINIVTKQPKADNFIAGSVGVGTDQYKRATVDGNYLLTDDVALRLNALIHSADTPGRDDVDVKKWGFAPSITFGMNSPTSVNLSYYHLNTDEMPDYGLPYTTVGRSKATPSKPVDVDKDNFYGLTNRDYRKTEVDMGTATLKHAFSETTVLRNVTRYSVSTNDYIVTNPDDSRGNVTNGTVWRNIKSRDSKTTTAANLTELSTEFNTAKIKHNFNTGVEVSHEETRNHPYLLKQVGFNNVTGNPSTCNGALLGSYDCTDLNNPNPDDPWAGSIIKNPAITTTTVTTKSIYAFDSLELTKQWFLNLGLRYDSYSTEADTPAYVRVVPTGNGLGGNAIGATVARTNFKNDTGFWNYQAGLVYKLQPNASIYASYGTSSTPTGVSAGSGADNITLALQDLEPERSKSFEIGTKWDVLDGLALTGAIFHIEKTNARATSATGTTELIGSQKVDGFELGAAGSITSKWQAFAGYTYLDSKLVDNGFGAANVANEGNQFPNVAKNSASIWTTYALTEKLTVGGGAFYTDKVFGNAANSVVIPSYIRYDAMATYKIDKNLNLQLNIQNLTDERYFDKAFTTHYAVVAPGRVGMLSLNFKY